MSGVFWEADKQPNLCDAASGFTLSTINLAVAIPMALVDIIVTVVTTLASFAWIILGPVIEYLFLGLAMVMEMVGLNDISKGNAILTMLIGVGTINSYLQIRGKANGCQKLVSRIIFQIKILLFVMGFVNFSPENAAYPKLALLSMAFQFGGQTIESLLKEFNNYNKDRQTTILDGAAAGIIKCLELESILLLIVAVFGYPTFSENEDVTKYYCLVPIVAIYLVYLGEVRPNCAGEDSVDHVNGDATIVKEALPATTNAPEETAAGIEEKAAEEATTEEEAPEAEKSVDGSTVENIEEVKTEAMIKRLQGCVCGLINKVLSIISPVTNLITKAVSIISNLPWTWMILNGSDLLSTILLTAAWFSLTSNILCYAIPVLNILLSEAVLAKVDKIPASIKQNMVELSSFTLCVVQYCLISGVTIVSESE